MPAAGAGGGTGLDADRTLALTYVPARRRPGVEALWRLDLALGQVLAGGRDPMLSRIKLVWWRDRLEELDRARAPAEPVLQALAEHVIGRGVAGAALAPMVEGWAALLSEDPLTQADLDTYAGARGGLLFRHSAVLLGGEADGGVEQGGEAWALVDLARHSNPVDAEAALAAAGRRLAAMRWPSALRPIGMLASLAARDVGRGGAELEPQGVPGRMVRMLRHRLTGS
ncbi:MAG TPA: squalene/phytoene synthase family protein [Allosphingosinicella sp.]|jgi:phytoene synthase